MITIQEALDALDQLDEKDMFPTEYKKDEINNNPNPWNANHVNKQVLNNDRRN